VALHLVGIFGSEREPWEVAFLRVKTSLIGNLQRLNSLFFVARLFFVRLVQEKTRQSAQHIILVNPSTL
jgi:hypothetical protein